MSVAPGGEGETKQQCGGGWGGGAGGGCREGARLFRRRTDLRAGGGSDAAYSGREEEEEHHLEHRVRLEQPPRRAKVLGRAQPLVIVMTPAALGARLRPLAGGGLRRQRRFLDEDE